MKPLRLKILAEDKLAEAKTEAYEFIKKVRQSKLEIKKDKLRFTKDERNSIIGEMRLKLD